VELLSLFTAVGHTGDEVAKVEDTGDVVKVTRWGRAARGFTKPKEWRGTARGHPTRSLQVFQAGYSPRDLRLDTSRSGCSAVFPSHLNALHPLTRPIAAGTAPGSPCYVPLDLHHSHAVLDLLVKRDDRLAALVKDEETSKYWIQLVFWDDRSSPTFGFFDLQWFEPCIQRFESTPLRSLDLIRLLIDYRSEVEIALRRTTVILQASAAVSVVSRVEIGVLVDEAEHQVRKRIDLRVVQ
jgi:hypothetical protein